MSKWGGAVINIFTGHLRDRRCKPKETVTCCMVLPRLFYPSSPPAPFTCLYEILSAWCAGVMQRVSAGIAHICHYAVFLHRPGLVIQKMQNSRKNSLESALRLLLPSPPPPLLLGARSNFVLGPAIQKFASLQKEFAVSCELHAALCYVG